MDQQRSTLGNNPVVLQDRYQLLELLGQGAYGEVHMALDKKEHKPVAVKMLIRGEQLSSKYVQQEILNHSRLIHPNVVQFFDVFLTSTHLVIVMEFAADGNLFSYVKRHHGLTEDEARPIFQQLTTALGYLHVMGVVHRDLKLENTLLDGVSTLPTPIIKICDFGYSKHEKRSLCQSRVGTPGYAAPEVLYNVERRSGQPADVWACGVMLYVMVFGRMPFEHDQSCNIKPALQVMRRTLRGRDGFGLPAQCAKTRKPPSRDLCDLLLRIFVWDPSLRATLHDIQAHPWFCAELPPAGVEGLEALTQHCVQLSHSLPPLYEKYVQQMVEQARQPPPDEMLQLGEYAAAYASDNSDEGESGSVFGSWHSSPQGSPLNEGAANGSHEGIVTPVPGVVTGNGVTITSCSPGLP